MKLFDKNTIKIFHDQAIAWIEKGKMIDSRTVKARSGTYLVCVKPKAYRSKKLPLRLSYANMFKHTGNEPFLTDLSGNVVDKDEKLAFILHNGLYIDTTEEYQKNSAANILSFKLTVKNENNNDTIVEVDKKTIIHLENKRAIIPVTISDSEYIHSELSKFDDSLVMKATIHALAKDPKNDRLDYLKWIVFVIGLVSVVIFENGGLALLKIW